METHKFWVYTIKTPNGLVYVGQSCQKYTSSRWNKKRYKNTSLEPYIDEFGWDNLIKDVVKEGIDSEKEAKKIENKLIDFYRIFGVCINKNKNYSSKEKKAEYYEKNKEKIAEYRKRYNEENNGYIKIKQKEWREKNKEYHSLYYQNHKEQNRERQRRYRERKRLKQQTYKDGFIPLF